MDTYHWDILVTYHWDFFGCLCRLWDLFESSGEVLMERCHNVPLRRHHDILRRRHGDVQMRCFDHVPLRCCWVFHLKRTCDVAGTYRGTLLRCCHDILLLGGCIVCEDGSKRSYRLLWLKYKYGYKNILIVENYSNLFDLWIHSCVFLFGV